MVLAYTGQSAHAATQRMPHYLVMITIAAMNGHERASDGHLMGCKLAQFVSVWAIWAGDPISECPLQHVAITRTRRNAEPFGANSGHVPTVP